MLSRLRASEAFPKPDLVIDGQLAQDKPSCPYELLAGEFVHFLGQTSDGGVMAVSNYRLHVTRDRDLRHRHNGPCASPTCSCINLPLSCVESVELRDLFYLHLFCKDARFYRIQLSDNAASEEWLKRLSAAVAPASSPRDAFAFCHFAWANEAANYDELRPVPDEGCNSCDDFDDPFGQPGTSHWFRADVARLRFDIQSVWRITRINQDFKFCASYPPEMLVPSGISDSVLEKVAQFRSARRIPAIVWRHTGNGAVLARCSQPEVGWLGWRSSEDEDLIRAVAEACAFDCGSESSSESSSSSLDYDGMKESSSDSLADKGGVDAHYSLKDLSDEVVVGCSRKNGYAKKVLIVDARSYAAAVGNRARGGGVEYPEYYPTCEIQFMGLANIHSIRKSFQALRAICNTTQVDQASWLQALDSTKWLHHLSGLLRAAKLCAKALCHEARPVIVHCSDGWDRTPQIVALTELLLDPYYRSLDGFRVLVEKEWLDFGHKMADRCGLASCVADQNERSPIFLQWLDCVHQLLLQFPCDFEFNHSYLFKLAQHTYSSLFGTFLCNSLQERRQCRVSEQTRSVWDFLAKNPYNFCNLLYHRRNDPLWPKCQVRDLLLWKDVYVSDRGRRGSPVAPASAPADAAVAAKSTQASKVVSTAPSFPLSPVPVDGSSENEDDLSSSSVIAGATPAPQVTRPNQQSDEGQIVPDDTVKSSTDTLVAETEVRDGSSSPCAFDVININSASDPEAMVHRPKVLLYAEAETGRSRNLRNSGENGRSGGFMNGHFHGAAAAMASSSPPPPPPPRPPWEVSRSAQDQADALFAKRFDADGLPAHHTETQRRLVAIYFAHQEQVDTLQRDLYLTRIALCRQKSAAKQESVGSRGKLKASDDDDMGVEDAVNGGSSQKGEAAIHSGCSTAASEASSSWEAVDERETKPTLWVPDHAAVACMGCQTDFWFGRRKHHCRNCGRLVCGDCSSRSLPLPSEQLYHPVRICDDCFQQQSDDATRKQPQPPDAHDQEAA